MEELNSGVLVKFLQEIDTDGSTLRDHKPVLLQIRSIIPVLRGGDLFPCQGFFLKVSDLSHALYVSLPQEQDEMVLYNKLHLGQLIYVDKLEAAYPVPMLKGVRPLHGRKPCYGDPKDLLPVHNLEKVLGMSNIIESIAEDDDPDVVEKRRIEKSQSLNSAYEIPSNENDINIEEKLCWKNEDNSDLMKKKPVEKSRSVSASRSRSNEGISRSPSHYKAKKSISESVSSNRARRKNNETVRGIQKNRSRSIDESSDVEITISGVSRTSRSNKPHWRGRHIPKAVDATDNLIFKHELKPSGDSTTYPSSPILYSRHSSYDGSASSKVKRIVNMPTRLPKINHKISSTAKETSEDTDDPKATSSSMNANNFTDTNISWEFLPQNLVILGKEVLRQRDVALHAAVEALLEASASEVLLKCLSTYSDQLSSAKENDQQPSVDKFLRLENDMARATLIFESIKTNDIARDTNKHNVDLSEEALQLAIERKQKAISWIKASLASDFNSGFDCTKVKDGTIQATNIKEGPTTANDIDKMVENFTLRRNSESNVEPKNQPCWEKGNLMYLSGELESTLHKESTRWFLSYVDGFLDWVSTKTTSSESDSEIAEMMFQIKRVNDWLDVKCKDVSILEESEVESCGRVRNKLYEILLKHAERTALQAMVQLH